MKGVFSIDIEDWYHILDLQNPEIGYYNWEKQEVRFQKNTDIILEILDKRNVKATFFVLGWIAEKYPEYIRKIANKKHEIASHGFKHELIYKITPKSFREDIRSSKALLEDITGQEVLGYRGPGFSIKKSTEWALDILIEEGFKYDSTIFPAKREHGGIAGYSRKPCIIKRENGEIYEIPISTRKIFLGNIAFCGGGYLRLFPYWYIREGIKEIISSGMPPIVYLHPREIDVEQPKIKMPWKRKFKTYVGLKTARKKIERLLDEFEWGTAIDLLSRNNF
ncbi:MAG: polysaccharide deacetylase family protein [Nanoarchaeota archaeon]|nr:polysaccharide deacetylase family protein [Nanoarchaeota archaeon]